jgi:hypothetical protein
MGSRSQSFASPVHYLHDYLSSQRKSIPIISLLLNGSAIHNIKVSRAVGVAGGSRKNAAILGALRGHWINILVTDHFTAKRLANE